MKSIFLALAFVTALSASANTPTNNVCNDLQVLSYKIMELRQAGVPVSTVIGASDGNRTVNGIIIAAYEEMQYSTKEYQVRASREFANKIYIECYKALFIK